MRPSRRYCRLYDIAATAISSSFDFSQHAKTWEIHFYYDPLKIIPSRHDEYRTMLNLRFHKERCQGAWGMPLLGDNDSNVLLQSN
ncbi:uncharacterized [Tachysurus ichikawai]